MDEGIKQQLNTLVNDNQVVLFMKGTRHFPQCGFSATVTQILDGLIEGYHTVNVLKEPEVREGIKEFSNWPTIPQLYVAGKFVGGCDIIREMYLEGELHTVLGVEDKVQAPKVTLTDAAQKAFAEASGDHGGVLRLEVSPRFEYDLALDEPGKGDFQVDAGGVTILVDRGSAQRANGIVIDYSSESGGGFKIDNPNEPPKVKQMSVQELKALIDSSTAFEFIDVRTPEEHANARIEGATLLDLTEQQRIAGLAKDTMLVFQCHHGGRSQAAAEGFLAEGFTNVHNVAGGIDAWSVDIDSSVPRY